MFAAHMDNSNQLQKWRAPNQSDIEPFGKNPRLFESQQNSGSDLTLFLNYPESDNKNNNLLSTDSVDRFSRMRGFFSLTQWHELELQALIFKYMLVGASVPAELVLAIKKSLVNSPYSYHHLHYQQPTQHYQPNMIPSGYWGKTMVDPEPGRCRRTDGKKWRCSKDVVSGQKYCERHMHRGRNRSRKPVEIPKTSVMGDLKGSITSLLTSPMKDSNFSLSGSPQSKDPGENERSASRRENALSDNFRPEESGSSGKSDSRVLRHFFDDFPRSREPVIRNNDSSPVSSTAHLSISIPRNNVSSDFSLKLSTGNGETPSRANDSAENRCLLFPPLQTNWSGWANQQETSVGGPLAEVLRSTSSPTSVLHKIQGCTPETSGISI